MFNFNHTQKISSTFKRPAIVYWCPDCGTVVRAKHSSIEDIEITYECSDETPIYASIDMNPTLFCYKCDGFMVELDDLIAERVVKLNKLGFNTAYSCQGHVEVSNSVSSNGDKIIDVITPYISFNYDRSNGFNPDISQCILPVLDTKKYPFLTKNICTLSETSRRIDIHASTPAMKNCYTELDNVISYSQDSYEVLTKELEIARSQLFAYIDGLIEVGTYYMKTYAEIKGLNK